MTDIKESVPGLEGFDIGPELPDNIARAEGENADTMKAAIEAGKMLTNKKIASLFSVKFFLGREKIEVYGSPINMSAKSEVLRSFTQGLIQHGGETHLAAGISVAQDIEPLMSVWLHMNSIPSDSYFTDFDQDDPLPEHIMLYNYDKVSSVAYSALGAKGLSWKPGDFIKAPADIPIHLLPKAVTDLSRIIYLVAEPHPKVTKGLRMWNWIKYFGISTKEHAFNHYVDWLRDLLWDYSMTFQFIAHEFPVRLPEEYMSIMQDLHSKLATLAVNDQLIHDNDSDNTNMHGMLVWLLKPARDVFYNPDYDLPEDKGYTYFGYDTKQVVEDEKQRVEEEKKREKDLEDTKRINKEMWEKLGPPPYPRLYEYYWPAFYSDMGWRENTFQWNTRGNPSFIDATISVPEGGYRPGEIVPKIPYEQYIASGIVNAIALSLSRPVPGTVQWTNLPSPSYTLPQGVQNIYQQQQPQSLFAPPQTYSPPTGYSPTGPTNVPAGGFTQPPVVFGTSQSTLL